MAPSMMARSPPRRPCGREGPAKSPTEVPGSETTGRTPIGYRLCISISNRYMLYIHIVGYKVNIAHTDIYTVHTSLQVEIGYSL